MKKFFATSSDLLQYFLLANMREKGFFRCKQGRSRPPTHAKAAMSNDKGKASLWVRRGRCQTQSYFAEKHKQVAQRRFGLYVVLRAQGLHHDVFENLQKLRQRFRQLAWARRRKVSTNHYKQNPPNFYCFCRRSENNIFFIVNCCYNWWSVSISQNTIFLWEEPGMIAIVSRKKNVERRKRENL